MSCQWNQVLGWQWTLKTLHYLHQPNHCLGDIMWMNVLFPSYYYLIFKYVYLNHFNYNYWFSSNIDTIYLFKFLVSIFEVMRSDDDTIENDKIMW